MPQTVYIVTRAFTTFPEWCSVYALREDGVILDFVWCSARRVAEVTFADALATVGYSIVDLRYGGEEGNPGCVTAVIAHRLGPVANRLL